MLKVKSTPLFVIGLLLLTAVFSLLFIFVRGSESLVKAGDFISDGTESQLQKTGLTAITVLTVFFTFLGGIFITKGLFRPAWLFIPAIAAAALIIWLCKFNIFAALKSAVGFSLIALASYVLSSLWEMLIIFKKNKHPGMLIMGIIGVILLGTGIFLFHKFGFVSKNYVVRVKTFLDILTFVTLAFGLLYFLVGWISGLFTALKFLLRIVGLILLYTIGLIIALASPPLFRTIRDFLIFYNKAKKKEESE